MPSFNTETPVDNLCYILLDVIRRNPGLDGLQLRAIVHNITHSRLKTIESLGWVEYRNSGWYVSETVGEKGGDR